MSTVASRALFKTAPGEYLKQLTWQLSVKHPIALYCATCFWGSSNTAYQYCPYGHGSMAPIAGFYDYLLGDI
jgi:hypothetical protein